MAGHAILIQKILTSSGKAYPSGVTGADTEKEFSIVLLNTSFPKAGKLKEPYNNDWKDENGEETFIPDVLCLAAYDTELEFGYKGGRRTAYQAYMRFIDFLTGRDGNGARLNIYDPTTRCGYCGCWLREPDDVTFTYNNLEDVLTWKMTFRVTEPESGIVLQERV